jgi:hypothetical protein
LLNGLGGCAIASCCYCGFYENSIKVKCSLNFADDDEFPEIFEMHAGFYAVNTSKALRGIKRNFRYDEAD